MDYTEKARERFSKDRFAYELTGIEIMEAGELWSRCRLTISDKHLNRNNNVMGGAIFTLADFAFGCAANTPVRGCVTLSSSINFMRASTGPVLYAEARCEKNGRRICFFIVTVTDDEGKIIAQAQFNGFRSEG
jgi:acyl-CoA thioesterase